MATYTNYDGNTYYKAFTDYINDNLLEVYWIHFLWVTFWISSLIVSGQIIVWILEEFAKFSPFIEMTG